MQFPQDPLVSNGFGYTQVSRITVLEPNPNLRLVPASYPFKKHESVIRAGFPMRAHTCAVAETAPIQVDGGLNVRHLNIRWTSWDRRILPIRPIWPGFAVNTIFHAGVLWLLVFGPFAFRRLIRRRRGLCPACAYPMGEAGVCTECGRPLPQRAVV